MATDIIAIDGPSASGKSTVAQRVAAALGYIYVDSGSLYRGATWQALQDGIDPLDVEQAVKWVSTLKMDFRVEDGAVRFTVNGVEPGEELRSEAVRENVSPLSAIAEVRERIVESLRALPRFGNLVVEGRDIGSVVFPDARLKVYLDADPEERARRRQKDLVGRDEQVGVGDVLDSLKRRDDIDASRKTAPLKVAEGAEVVDTTNFSIDEVVSCIIAKCRP